MDLTGFGMSAKLRPRVPLGGEGSEGWGPPQSLSYPHLMYFTGEWRVGGF